MDERAPYESPTITEIAGVHELTLAAEKHDQNTPDGFEFAGIILTS